MDISQLKNSWRFEFYSHEWFIYESQFHTLKFCFSNSGDLRWGSLWGTFELSKIVTGLKLKGKNWGTSSSESDVDFTSNLRSERSALLPLKRYWECQTTLSCNGFLILRERNYGWCSVVEKFKKVKLHCCKFALCKYGMLRPTKVKSDGHFTTYLLKERLLRGLESIRTVQWIWDTNLSLAKTSPTSALISSEMSVLEGVLDAECI